MTRVLTALRLHLASPRARALTIVTAVLVQARDGCHISFAQLEVKQAQVLSESALVARLGHDGVSPLASPAQANLTP